jgi:ADP-heptose:LPS heptosyltransferase
MHGHISDFGDTATIINQLDLIISVDTSVAHLAGALGKPVWILLCANADWRWFIDRTDSPWYPSATLFRQSVFGQWDDVIHNVKKSLSTFKPI